MEDGRGWHDCRDRRGYECAPGHERGDANVNARPSILFYAGRGGERSIGSVLIGQFDTSRI